jgi:glycosyltransferase involved in cell wall biosynthesis
MPGKVKVIFVIPTLETGGAQKVLSILLRNIATEKFDITLCVLTDTGVFYDDIPKSIKKVYLKISRVRYAWFKLFRFIKDTNPDIVFVFDVNHLSLIVGILSFLLPKKIKYIAREAAVLTEFINGYPFLQRTIQRFLYNITFTRYDLLICQSQYMSKDLIDNFDVSEAKIIVINNPVEFESLKRIPSEVKFEKKETFNLIAVGRIVYVKGYDLLIEALSKVKKKNFHLTILGDKTPESPGYSESVSNLVERHGLSEKISFLGFTSNPHLYVQESDLLIIASRSEAFSNVAIEANAVGTPVLAFNCPGGMAEIIVQGFNGWLVENGNVNMLAEQIDKVFDLKVDKPTVISFTKGKYSTDKIIPLYENALMDVYKSRYGKNN